MKKKYIFVISIVFVFSLVFPFGLVNANSNRGHINFMENYGLKDNYMLKNNKTARNSINNMLKKRNRQLRVTPASYDLRVDRPSWTDGPRDQGSHGTCWSFASAASMESSLVRNGIIKDLGGQYSHNNNIYLSPKHIVYSSYNKYMYYSDSPLDDGGNYGIANASLSRGFGPNQENLFPYSSAASPIVDLNIFKKQRYQIYDASYIPSIVKEGAVRPLSFSDYDNNILDYVKYSLVKYGVLYVSFRAPTTNQDLTEYYNSDHNAFYDYSNLLSSNHAVSIVGYDDNFPKENFTGSDATKMPPADGAFIIKNSWGTSGPLANDNGHFYLSYYDQTITGSAIMSLMNIKSGYALDMYDTLGNFPMEDSPSNVQNKLSYSNIFSVPNNKNEILNGISYQSPYDLSLKTTAKIYTNLKDSKNPESGTKVAEFRIDPSGNQGKMNGLNDYIGFHTYNFSDYGVNPIKLSPNTKYSVVIYSEKTSNSDRPSMPIEFNYAREAGFGSDGGFDLQYNQSFISVDGGKYTDLMDYYTAEYGSYYYTFLLGNPNVRGILNTSNAYITSAKAKKVSKKKLDFTISISNGLKNETINLYYGKYLVGQFTVNNGHIIIKGKSKVKKFYKALKKSIKKAKKKHKKGKKYKISFNFPSSVDEKSIKIKALY